MTDEDAACPAKLKNQRIAELTEREIAISNRQLNCDLAHAALDFWRRLGDMPIEAALETFAGEIREAYATRRAKPPYVASQASLIP